MQITACLWTCSRIMSVKFMITNSILAQSVTWYIHTYSVAAVRACLWKSRENQAILGECHPGKKMTTLHGIYIINVSHNLKNCSSLFNTISLSPPSYIYLPACGECLTIHLGCWSVCWLSVHWNHWRKEENMLIHTSLCERHFGQHLTRVGNLKAWKLKCTNLKDRAFAMVSWKACKNTQTKHMC